MTDVVVTVPKRLWFEWIDEGDLPGEPWSEIYEYTFYLAGSRPDIHPGERVYVVAHGRLRGYAPLVRLARCGLVRRGGAVAVTIDEEIRGFQGFRYRWWARDAERPFAEWRTEGVAS